MSDIPAGPATSLEARSRLVEALQVELVGPSSGHRFSHERIPPWYRPTTWYLTGFLVPTDTPPEHRSDDDEEDDFADLDTDGSNPEESVEERRAAKRGYFPSSMGLSFLLPPEARELTITVRWGDYKKEDSTEEEGPTSYWQRYPREEHITVPTGKATHRKLVPDSAGLIIHVVEREVAAGDYQDFLPAGVRSVSVFLVNERSPREEAPDESFAFQAEIEVGSDRSFMARPDLRGANADEWDDRVSDLHYADTPEFATGHGVSADWDQTDGECHAVRTVWMPLAGVEKTTTVDVPGVELSLDTLGELADGPAVHTALDDLVAQYRGWIEEYHEKISSLSKNRQETARELLRYAKLAADRIEKGIATLEKNPDALDAFRVANRAVAKALRQRLGSETTPKWRVFQLAFILLNIPGLADPSDPGRRIVDLLFFPTGGGKTEAYLGLSAFTMVLRRLQNPAGNAHAGAGVSVIMRYTLRLLTLDQYSRAAGLVCALELERREAPERYGEWPFEIGLWVGKAATPNVLGHKGEKGDSSARKKVKQFKSDPKNKPSPIPLEVCPWCGTPFGSHSFDLLPNSDNPTSMQVSCMNLDCDFSSQGGLPVVAVDEPLYRRLPAFLIATVDKFASLPWTGRSGALLGGADRYEEGDGFYGPAEPGKGKKLSAALLPPDLIIQDELHLISGPLGTMAGLYETAIDALCVRQVGDQEVGPKIVASTATVRKANDQIQALFGRAVTQVFPPPGPDRRDSFFARTRPAEEVPARLYLGVAAQGVNPKVILRKTWLSLMGITQRIFLDAGGFEKKGNNPADPYMTVLGYFNSLRELGGARRILEEEVQNTLKKVGSRRRLGEEYSVMQDRPRFSEVVELTSRVSTSDVSKARERLNKPFIKQTDYVDSAIATNMISVGLDIPRLGTMVVFGQPKTHSEYIQATSRVGRDDKKPGIVIDVLNIHKPRDRSHYERFRHYHETFYRSVEVGSVTPFSARALDRGFAGALVTLARHVAGEMVPPDGVLRIRDLRAKLEEILLRRFFLRIDAQPNVDGDEVAERRRTVKNRVGEILDAWVAILDHYQGDGIPLRYQKHEGKPAGGKYLLREMLESDTGFDIDAESLFRVNRSLRDVEPNVDLFLKSLNGKDVE